MNRIALLSAALLALPAAAADKAPPKKQVKSAKGAPQHMDLGLGGIGTGSALPTNEKLDKPKGEKLGDLKQGAESATYEVTKVMHGHSFMRSPTGSTAMGGELKEIALSGNPPSTEKFTTMIRVHSKGRDNVPIEVAVVDPRGDTVMSSEGSVHFQGVKQDDVDYQIDWDPTPLRGPGEYKMLVRVANEVKGTYPLTIVDKK